MTAPTTPAERAEWLRDYHPNGPVARLIADVERLEAEVESLSEALAEAAE